MSPTFLTIDGFRIILYFNDHMPAHAHVKKAEHEARVALQPVAILDHTGFTNAELRRILRIVNEYRSSILDEWKRLRDED